MSVAPVSWTWRGRREPVEPHAAVAWGDAARRLHARLSRLPEEQAGRLHATANRDVLVVLGATADLPWVEGVEYAVADERAPALWLPTRWEPEIPVDLLGRTLSARFGRTPLLLWRDPPALLPLDRQLPVTPLHLQRIQACWAER